MDGEIWRPIAEFPNYEISSVGSVYSIRFNKFMRTSQTPFGHVKITLTEGGKRYTRSVAHLVAEAFVEPPSVLCDHVVVLDGDPSNVAAENLVWRPRGFAWKYAHQLKTPQPVHYKNLPVLNVTTGNRYHSVIATGMTEGLLFDDIWRSTYTGAGIFPYGEIFEIMKRV